MHAKATYVLSQGQTRLHHCHWPGCDKQVAPAKWGCTEHWFRLPKHLRNKIWDAFRPGQEKTLTPSRSYVSVAREVQEWILYDGERTKAMIIWELSTTDGTDTSYRFFGMKGEASKAKRDFKKSKIDCEGPTKVKVVNRDQLIELIAKVQGSAPAGDGEEVGDAASEFL